MIYSTKQRVPCLHSAIRPALYAYKAGILQNWESPAIVIGGVEDHVHVLFELSKNYSLAKIVEEIKKGSSKWIKGKGPEFHEFHWQNGYGAFSVSQSNVPAVRKYIEKQEDHHRTLTFQDELRAFLKRHGMTCDELYVWD